MRLALLLMAAGIVLPAVGSAERSAALSGSQEPVVSTYTANWPSFRGEAGLGVADGADLPDILAAAAAPAWRTPIPGLGHSSPIVWGDRVYLTSAVTSGAPQRFLAELPDSPESLIDDATHRWIVMAIDRRSGQVLWERTAVEAVPRTGRMRKASFANATPVTDGQHVVALLGSQGLFCYDIEGNLLWHVDLGVLSAGWFFDATFEWGTASSPVIHDGKVIVQADVRGGAFIAAFDVADGNELWRTARDEVSSFATPAVVSFSGGTEIVTNGGRALRAYDPDTGEELWTLGPSSEIAAATPIFVGGLIFAGSGYLPTQPFYAIGPGGRGDISLAEGARAGRNIRWSVTDAGPLLSTPIIVGNLLFILQRDGTVTCFDAGSGIRLFSEQIGAREAEEVAQAAARAAAAAAPEGEEPAPTPAAEMPTATYSASPVAADGRIYVATDTGEIHVLQAGAFLEVLGTYSLGEAVFATPAIADGMLLVRGRNHLFAFSR